MKFELLLTCNRTTVNATLFFYFFNHLRLLYSPLAQFNVFWWQLFKKTQLILNKSQVGKLKDSVKPANWLLKLSSDHRIRFFDQQGDIRSNFFSYKAFNTDEELRFNDVTLESPKFGQPLLTAASLRVKFFIFKIFFLFNHSQVNQTFKANDVYSFFQFNTRGSQLSVFNYQKFFARWLVSYDFLLNMSYYRVIRLVLTSPLFRFESEAMNWNIVTWNLYTWKYFYAFFFQQVPSYSHKLSFFFRKFKDYDIRYFVVSDLFYHNKHVFYLKKHMYFTVGLVSSNQNPFLVDFPIVAFFENYIIQAFFLKLILFADRQAQYMYYLKLKQTWFLHKNYYYL